MTGKKLFVINLNKSPSVFLNLNSPSPFLPTRHDILPVHVNTLDAVPNKSVMLSVPELQLKTEYSSYKHRALCNTLS